MVLREITVIARRIPAGVQVAPREFGVRGTMIGSREAVPYDRLEAIKQEPGA
jgi:hypothetical protein